MTKLEGKQEWINNKYLKWNRTLKRGKIKVKRKKETKEALRENGKYLRRSKILIIGVSDGGMQRNRKIMWANFQGYFADIK